MIFSTPAQYALRGLCELALKSPAAKGAPSGVVMLDQLVEGTDLPREYLSKVFQQLVKAQILASIKGRGGGFTLTRPIHEVTLLQVVQAIDGPDACDQCALGLNACDDSVRCPQHELFKPIRRRLKDYLQTTTVADLVASLRVG